MDSDNIILKKKKKVHFKNRTYLSESLYLVIKNESLISEIVFTNSYLDLLAILLFLRLKFYFFIY